MHWKGKCADIFHDYEQPSFIDADTNNLPSNADWSTLRTSPQFPLLGYRAVSAIQQTNFSSTIQRIQLLAYFILCIPLYTICYKHKVSERIQSWFLFKNICSEILSWCFILSLIPIYFSYCVSNLRTIVFAPTADQIKLDKCMAVHLAVIVLLCAPNAMFTNCLTFAWKLLIVCRRWNHQ